MTRSDANDIIASRTFERADGMVELSIYRPLPYPKPAIDADPDNPPWRCDYKVIFPEGEIKRGYTVGIDSIQALLLGFAGAKHTLTHMGNGTPDRRPPIRWLGNDDLGLTIDHHV